MQVATSETYNEMAVLSVGTSLDWKTNPIISHLICLQEVQEESPVFSRLLLVQMICNP